MYTIKPNYIDYGRSNNNNIILHCLEHEAIVDINKS